MLKLKEKEQKASEKQGEECNDDSHGDKEKTVDGESLHELPTDNGKSSHELLTSNYKNSHELPTDNKSSHELPTDNNKSSHELQTGKEYHFEFYL